MSFAVGEESKGALSAAAEKLQDKNSGQKLWASARGSVLAYQGLGGRSTSFFLEKQAVVIDFGRSCTKVGFATESRPRHIVPSPQLRAWGQRNKNLTTTLSQDEWVDILDRLLSQIFFHYLNVSPKERRVVLCDSIYSSTQFRNAVALVLFKRLTVPSVAFVVNLTLPLYLTGLSSGIVIDIGYDSTRVLATFAGVPVLSAFSTARGGGQLIGARLQKCIKANLPPGSRTQWLDDPWELEDLMARICYVACDISEKEPEDEEPVTLKLRSGHAASYTSASGEIVSIPEVCRWQPAEVLFKEGADENDGEDPDEDGDCTSCATIPEAFAQLVERCPVDVRAAAVQNIVVCGGCAALKGLLPRLAVEVRAEMRRRPHLRRLAEHLLFTPLDFHPMCAVWTGGAVCGSLEGSHDYSASSYAQSQPLPDWARDGFV